MTYDFTTLSPDDFENLTADLLSSEWGQRLETFKSGKDSGIDLRNSRVLSGKLPTFVQCKRYAPHKFAELCRNIKKEKKKLDAIKPKRYVLVTSVSLSPANKELLLGILSPWCKSTGDIYGASEINGLLRDHPDVERSNFKLWVSSTAVLERVLHSRIFNVTQATLESTKTCMSRIVMHDGFNRALQMLRQDHHVLIVGNPGIGKTTLARVIMCQYMREQFEPICVLSNIDDAWNVVHESMVSKRKMVVFYDDFLGRLRFDSQRFGKNEELSLVEFLNQVRRSSNLRLILTTREYILADAQRVHGAFASHVKEILKCTLTLEDYSKMHRAKMLFNHLYFSDLPDSRLEKLICTKVYKQIVQHNHFNPRVVETISKYANSRALNDDEYIRYVQQEFDSPSKLWEQPFRYDISPIAQEILAILWTFGGTAEVEMLKSAIVHLHEHRDIGNLTMLFTDGLRQLDGNFISTNAYPGHSGTGEPFIVAQFHNPSVEEFVETFLLSEPTWLQRLTQGIVCFGQVETLFAHATNKERSHRLDERFWIELRKVAARTEYIPGGYLINFRPMGEGGARMTWFKGDEARPNQTLVLLKIEVRMNIRDSYFAVIQRRVRTKEGWSYLISGVSSDESISYGLSTLDKWVAEESCWSSEIKEECHTALRGAVHDFLQDEEEIWPCTIGSLRVLAETVSRSGAPMQDIEKTAFLSAAKIATETIKDNAENSEEVKREADELATLERICDVNLSKELASLSSYADYLSEREGGDESPDPNWRNDTHSHLNEDFDIDSLFDGLLDR